MNDSDFFDYNTGILAWFLSDILHDEISQKKMPYYYSDITDSWDTPYHIQLLTWGVGANTNKMSNVLDRYCSRDNFSSAARADKHNSLIKSQIVRKDVEAFRNNIIRIY